MEYEFVFLAELHIQIRIALVHASFNTIVYRIEVTRGNSIFMSELPYASESEERTETECCCRMGINEGVANKNTIFVMLEDHLFLKQHTTDTIDGCRDFVAIELANVLMSHRTKVVALILMQAKIKFCSMLYDCNIKR